MSPNEHIKIELENFKNKKSRAFYAIQIDAPWGAGKTHFISSYLRGSVQENGEDGGGSGLHITLFGAQSVGDLEKQVFSQLFSKSERTVGRIMSTLTSGFAGFFQVDKALEGPGDELRDSILASRLEKMRNGLIVFDDIERSRMPLKDALGYINRFIELEGFKVVLISNESAMNNESASIYEKNNATIFRSFREKLIGRTLRLVADPVSAYPKFVESMSCEVARQIARREMSSALALFDASGRENLRSIRIGLESFDRIIPVLDPIFYSKDKGLRDILLSCLYVAIEHAAGCEKAVIVAPHQVAALRFSRNIRAGSEALPPCEARADDIIRRYGTLLNLAVPVLPWETIWNFIAEGHLDAVEIKKSAKISPLMADPRDVPIWRLLIDIWHLDASRLADETLRALRQFELLAIRDPGEILHLAGIMLWRESMGDRTLSGGCSSFEFIRDYISRLHDSDQGIDPDFRIFDFDRHTAYGYIVLGAYENNVELAKIADLIDQSMQISARKKFPEMRQNLISFMVKNDRNLNKISEIGGGLGDYLKFPLFFGSDPGDFADLIMRNNKFDHDLIGWLESRYENPNDARRLRSEREWLEGLRVELKRRIASVSPPLSVFWDQRTDKHLNSALNRIANS